MKQSKTLGCIPGQVAHRARLVRLFGNVCADAFVSLGQPANAFAERTHAGRSCDVTYASISSSTSNLFADRSTSDLESSSLLQSLLSARPQFRERGTICSHSAKREVA